MISNIITCMEIIDTLSNPPVVSIYMTTYNHEKYIGQAIDSIFSQKCNFEYEVCISDDASKDKTCEIIEQYQKDHPNIRLNQNEKNIGLTANFYLVKNMCRGKYIVVLSGDDYWIDDHKLEKQVNFLETHPDYLAVGTVVEQRADNSTEAMAYLPEKQFWNQDFTLDMFLEGHNCELNGMMMRNVYIDPEKKELFALMPKMSKYIDDLTDELLIHMSGKVFTLPDPTVAYRVRVKQKGDKNFSSINKGMVYFEKHLELMNNLVKQFGKQVDLFGRYKEVVANGMLTAMRNKQIKQFMKLCESIPQEYRERHVIRESMKLLPAKVAERLKSRL